VAIVRPASVPSASVVPEQRLSRTSACASKHVALVLFVLPALASSLCTCMCTTQYPFMFRRQHQDRRHQGRCHANSTRHQCLRCSAAPELSLLHVAAPLFSNSVQCLVPTSQCQCPCLSRLQARATGTCWMSSAPHCPFVLMPRRPISQFCSGTQLKFVLCWFLCQSLVLPQPLSCVQTVL
jgi:hypothetical protein